MTSLPVYNQKGEAGGSIELTKVFEERLNPDVVHQVVVAERANARASIAHTKTRGEVAGSGRKPWRQKGTGRARVGSIRSPIWRHGGVTFGPRSIRNFSQKVNRSQFHKAVRMVLSEMARTGQLAVIESLTLPAIKTKPAFKLISEFRKAAKLPAQGAVIVKAADPILYRSLRNVPGIEVMRISDISPYRLLRANNAVITREALAELERIYAR